MSTLSVYPDRDITDIRRHQATRFNTAAIWGCQDGELGTPMDRLAERLGEYRGAYLIGYRSALIKRMLAQDPEYRALSMSKQIDAHEWVRMQAEVPRWVGVAKDRKLGRAS